MEDDKPWAMSARRWIRLIRSLTVFVPVFGKQLSPTGLIIILIPGFEFMAGVPYQLDQQTRIPEAECFYTGRLGDSDTGCELIWF